MAPPRRTGACSNGHPFKESYRRPSGILVCRPCRRASKKRWVATHKAHARRLQNAATNRYRKSHREKYRVIAQERSDRYKRQLIEEKGGRCRDCKQQFEDRPEVFDFDHIGEKQNAIARLLRRVSWTRIQLEARECELVCSNCHRTRTKDRLKELRRDD